MDSVLVPKLTADWAICPLKPRLCCWEPVQPRGVMPNKYRETCLAQTRQCITAVARLLQQLHIGQNPIPHTSMALMYTTNPVQLLALRILMLPLNSQSTLIQPCHHLHGDFPCHMNPTQLTAPGRPSRSDLTSTWRPIPSPSPRWVR